MACLKHLWLLVAVLHSTLALPIQQNLNNDVWVPSAETTTLHMLIPRSTPAINDSEEEMQIPATQPTSHSILDLGLNININITRTTTTDIHSTNAPDTAPSSSSSSAGWARMSKREPWHWPKRKGYLRHFFWDDPPEDLRKDPHDVLDGNGKKRSKWHQFWHDVGDQLNEMKFSSGW